MNIRILFLFFVFLFDESIALAQPKLHAFLIANTVNPLTGQGHRKNLERMKEEVNNIAHFTGLRMYNYVLDSIHVSRENIETMIDRLECKKEDVILFYFSGEEYLHKVKGQDEKSVLKTGEGFMEIERVQTLLSQKKPRLSVVLTDLCNQAGNDVFFELLETMPDADRYHSLFVQSEGEVMMSSHVAKDQSDVRIGEEGSIFTGSIIQAIRSQKEANTWKDVGNNAKSMTVLSSRGSQNPQTTSRDRLSDLQTPIVPTPTEMKVTPNNVSLSGKETPAIKPIEKPEPTKAEIPELPLAKITAESMEKINSFQNQLSQLAFAGASEQTNRKNLISSMMNLFADKNRIIELSGMNDQVIRKNLNAYLGTLYSSDQQGKILISWYKPAEIGEFLLQSDASYQSDVKIFQEYKKVDASGQFIYGDKVEKKVRLTVRNQGGEWKISMGDISVVKGTSTTIKE
jgi:Caspase domain